MSKIFTGCSVTITTVLFCVSAIYIPAQSEANDYTLIDLGANVTPRKINNNGQLVGEMRSTTMSSRFCKFPWFLSVCCFCRTSAQFARSV
jgi:hypothetical protein